MAPSRRAERALWYSGRHRRVWPTLDATPLASKAATMRLASSIVVASGFSTNTPLTPLFAP